jgi:hypothetical protein
MKKGFLANLAEWHGIRTIYTIDNKETRKNENDENWTINNAETLQANP